MELNWPLLTIKLKAVLKKTVEVEKRVANLSRKKVVVELLAAVLIYSER
jgi:hypothetical protein